MATTPTAPAQAAGPDLAIAELQRTNTELRRQLDERDAALARRNIEFGERLEQQAATIDVLKVMSGSPGDPQPVFDLIVRRATELCNGVAGGLFEYDGHSVQYRAWHYAEGSIRPGARDAHIRIIGL